MKRLAAVLLLACMVVACGSSTRRPLVGVHAPSRLAALIDRTAGAPTVGEVLTTSNGTWSNSPTLFSYQWQRCSGACSNIPGATASSYTVQAADVGDTIDVIVTASNGAGSAQQTSAQTGVVVGGGAVQVGAPTPSGVTCTSAPLNAGANVASAVAAAAPGSTVCLNAGAWSAISLSNISPAAPGVTLAATPGQAVSIPGFTLTSDNNLTVEGFYVQNLSRNGFDILCQINSGDTITHNTIENLSGHYGIHSLAEGCGNNAATQSGISITYNQIDHAGGFIEVQGNNCACASADQNWMISHNVLGPGQDLGSGDHYIQGQWVGATITNNAFEGPTADRDTNTGAHNNVLHCYTTNAPGCQNITFSNNILWHTDSRAQSVLITDNNLTNIVLQNNLDVEDPAPACYTGTTCPASPWFIEKGFQFTLKHNTSVNVPWSINLGTCGDGCPTSPNTWDAEWNIAVGTPQQGQNNYGTWACQTSCTVGNNVSQENSANTDWGSGAGANVINWTPSWQDTNWTPNNGQPWNPPPADYYKPAGISASFGYQGTVGP